MISKDKTYKTRDGREVRIYAVDGEPDFPVHGAVKTLNGNWSFGYWTASGKSCSAAIDLALDLIEVRPRIVRKVWVNVYRHDDGEEFLEVAFSKDELDAVGDARIACVRLTIDCEEGEGL